MKKFITVISLVAAIAVGANASDFTDRVSELKDHTRYSLYTGYGKIYGNNGAVVSGSIGTLIDNETLVNLKGSYAEDSYDITYGVTKKIQEGERFIFSGGASVQYVNFKHDTSVTTYKEETVLVEDGKGNTTEQTQTVPVTTVENKTYDDYLIGLHLGATDKATGLHVGIGFAKGVQNDLGKATIGATLPIKTWNKGLVSVSVQYERTIISGSSLDGVDTVKAGIHYSF